MEGSDDFDEDEYGMAFMGRALGIAEDHVWELD